MVTVKDLRCNYLENPLGVDDSVPQLSWKISSAAGPIRQAAYRILVASAPELLSGEIGDLWDTGEVRSEDNIHIAYSGRPLTSSAECWWKVAVWDRIGCVPSWSPTAFWRTGLFRQEDWQANWIAASVSDSKNTAASAPAPLFRRRVDVFEKIRHAWAYVSGVGYFELTVNGRKAGGDVLAPLFTKYDSTVLYNAYDVTDAFHQGENVIGVCLGNGWYNCIAGDAWNFNDGAWRDRPKLILRIEVLFENGERFAIVSDSSWRFAEGPIRFNGVRNGEHYDARLEKPGWDRPGYDDSGWGHAVVVRGPGGLLKSSASTAVRRIREMDPAAVRQVKTGVRVYDFGINFSGWVKMRVRGPAGTELIFRYSESVGMDGDVDRREIERFVKDHGVQEDRYILKGGREETWEPRFTYHGFRYIQVTGSPEFMEIKACEVHSAFPDCGSFQCSDGLLNAIQDCVRRSTLSNWHGIPTDCPHREKNGWTGDAQLSAEQTLYNFGPVTDYIKWLRDFRDAQRPNGQLPGMIPTAGWGYNWGSGPAWDSAVILIPWDVYLFSADCRLLRDEYDTMKRYVRYLGTMSSDCIVDFGLGDWCPPEGIRAYRCPSVVTDTAYYYTDSLLLSKIAGILGRQDDREEYQALARRIQSAFQARFVDEATGYVTGGCQTSMSCALYHGLVDGAVREKVFRALVREVERKEYHIDCGILGTKYLLRVLTEYGRADIAYRIARQTTFPGWGWWIMQGATTLWETWDGAASHNHHMFSSIGDWFYRDLGGISPDPEDPGFHHIMIRPHPVEGISWVKTWHRSLYGHIVCNWSVKNGSFTLKVTVPANCTATVTLPPGARSPRLLSGEAAGEPTRIKTEEDAFVAGSCRFDSGTYRIEADIGAVKKR